MRPLHRWALLIMALLFILGGSYAVQRKTGGWADPGTKIITPMGPHYQRQPHS